MIIKKVLRLVISNAIAIFATSLILEGLVIAGDPLITILIAAGALGVAQYTVKPLLKVVSFPINAVTLGLFNIVINALVLWLVVYFVPDLYTTAGTIYLSLPFVGEVIPATDINELLTLLAASLSISIINWLLKKLVF